MLRRTIAELNRGILEEPFESKLVFVRWASTGKPVCVWTEHGDGDGLSMATEFIEDCVRDGLVKPNDLRLDVTDVLT